MSCQSGASTWSAGHAYKSLQEPQARLKNAKNVQVGEMAAGSSTVQTSARKGCVDCHKEGPLSYKLIYKSCYKYRKSIYKSHNYIYKFDEVIT